MQKNVTVRVSLRDGSGAFADKVFFKYESLEEYFIPADVLREMKIFAVSSIDGKAAHAATLDKGHTAKLPAILLRPIGIFQVNGSSPQVSIRVSNRKLSCANLEISLHGTVKT